VKAGLATAHAILIEVGVPKFGAKSFAFFLRRLI
jgi:hypothetical protein